MSISLLPPHVQTYLRSGVAISTPSQCVEELVLNSLDASATCIAVRVDLHAFKMQVVDNGCGISPQAMKLVGERYATSKCHSMEDLGHLNYYGYRGEALASVRQMSCVMEIESLATSNKDAYSKLFSFGRVLSLQKSSNPRPGPGTTITLHNFMYNLPVRRQRINETFTFEDIRQRLESIALIHPEVSFSLRNDVTNQKCIQTKKETSILATFSQLFGQSQANALCPVAHTVDIFTVKGFISTNGFYNSSLQFIYVNKRLILKTRLHKAVNACFAKSLIARSKGRRISPCAGQVSSPPKSGEKWGIYVLDLNCPFSEYDVCLDPNKSLVEFKNWDSVLKCFQEVVDNFLVSENLKSCTVESPSFQSMCSLEQNVVVGRCTQNYDGNSIQPQDMKHTLQSLPAKRACSQHLNSETAKAYGCVATTRKPEDSPCDNEAVEIANTVDNSSAELIGSWEEAVGSKKVTLRSTLDLVPVSYTKFKLIAQQRFSEDRCEDELSGNSTCKNSSVPCSSLQAFKQTFVRTKGEVWSCKTSPKSKSPDGVIGDADQVLVKPAEKCASVSVVPQHISINVKKGHSTCKTLGSLQKFKFTLVKDNPTKYKKYMSEENNYFVAQSSAPKMSASLTVQEYNQSNVSPKELTEEIFSDLSSLNKNISICDTSLVPQTLDVLGSSSSPLKSTTLEHDNAKLLLTENEAMVKDTSKLLREQDFPTSLSLIDVPSCISAKYAVPFCEQGREDGIVKESGGVGQITWKYNCQQTSVNSQDIEEVTQASKEKLRNMKVSTMLEEDSRTLCCELNTPRHRTRFCPNSIHSVGGTLSLQSSSHTYKNKGGLNCPVVENVHNCCATKVLANFENENESRSRQNPRAVLEVDSSSSQATTYSRASSNCFSDSTPLPRSQANEMVPMLNGVKYQMCRNQLIEKSMNSCNASPFFICPTRSKLSAPSEVQPGLKYGLTAAAFELAVPVQCRPTIISQKITSESEQHKANKADDPECSGELFTEPECRGFVTGSENNVLHCTHNGKSEMEESLLLAHHCDLLPFVVKDDCKTNLTGGELSKSINNYSGSLQRTVDEGTEVHLSSNSVEYGDVNPHTICGSQEEEVFALVYSEPPKKKTCMVHNDNNFPIFIQHKETPDDKRNKVPSAGTSEELVASLQTWRNAQMDHSYDRMPVKTYDQENSSDSRNYEIQSTQPFELGCDMDADESLYNIGIHQTATASSELLFSQTASPSRVKHAFFASSRLLESDLGCEESLLEVERKSQMVSKCSWLTVNLPQRDLHKSCDTIVSQSPVDRLNGEVCGGNPPPHDQTYHSTQPASSDYSSYSWIKRSPQMYITDCEKGLMKAAGQNYWPHNHDKLTTNLSLQELRKSSESTESPIPDERKFNQSDERKDLPWPNNRKYDSFMGMDQFLTPFSSWKVTNIYNIEKEQQQPAVEVNSRLKMSEVVSSPNEKLCSESDSDVEKDNRKNQTVSLPILSKSCQSSIKSKMIEESPEVVCSSSPTLSVTDMKGMSTYIEAQQILSPETSLKNQADGQENIVPVNTDECREDVKRSNFIKASETDKLRVGCLIKCVDSAKEVILDPPREPRSVNEVDGDMDHDSMWLCQVDAASGKTVYVHQGTGLSSFDPPPADKLFIMRSDIGYESASLLGSISTPFHPHSTTGRANANKAWTSSAMQCDDKLYVPKTDSGKLHVKWRNVQEAELAVSSVIPLLQEWENPMWKRSQEEVSGISVKDAFHPAPKMYPLLHICQLDRAFLQSCKVLNQLDNKFIVCLSSPDSSNRSKPSLVVLFDQHAVHERIRLEHLQAGTQGEISSGMFQVKSHPVEPPMEVNLSLAEVRVVGSCLPVLQRWGFEVVLHPSDRTCIYVRSVPSFLLEREASEVKRKRPSVAKLLVQDILQDGITMLQATGGASHIIPQSLHNVLCSQACHGAVKFGDPLDVQECRELVRLLCKCRLPFQCAHGRPTVVPLLNLDMLSQKDTLPGNNKPKLWKLRQFKEKKESAACKN